MNWIRFFAAAIFYIQQNRYFGWNSFPQSDAELIVDGITILLIALSVEHEAKQ